MAYYSLIVFIVAAVGLFAALADLSDAAYSHDPRRYLKAFAALVGFSLMAGLSLMYVLKGA